MKTYTRDPAITCPLCSCTGRCEYIDVPESILTYQIGNEEEITEHLPATKHYGCRNCDAAFIVLDDAT